MDSIFDATNYRRILAAQSLAWKRRRPGMSLAGLARRAKLQAPYLTNVLKERAHLSADQLFSVSRILGFAENETAYVLLLLDWERSEQSERKALLRAQIDKARRGRLNVEKRLKAEVVGGATEATTRYWIHPEMQLVLTFLGVPRFAANFVRIAESLNIELSRVDEIVRELKELGLLRVGNKGLEKTKSRMHLAKDSPLCAPQQLLLHYRSLQHQQLLSPAAKFNFAVTFTADEKTREKIQVELLKFLETTEALVKNAPSESVYQLNLDLFPWSR